MNHETCDHCGELLTKSEVRYEVRIEIKAAYDPLEVDVEKHVRPDLANVLRQVEQLSEDEAQDQVYRLFEFDLCVACQKKFVREPLA